MTRLRANQSRAASLPETEARLTEMENGILISKPLKKVQEVSEVITTTNEPLTQVWSLTKDGPILQSRACSVLGINKLREIHDFIISNGGF